MSIVQLWIVQSDNINMNLRRERVSLPVLEGQISLIFLIITKDRLTSMIVESLLTLRNQCSRSWCKLWLKDSSWLRVQATWFIHQLLLMASHSFHYRRWNSRICQVAPLNWKQSAWISCLLVAPGWFWWASSLSGRLLQWQMTAPGESIFQLFG